jgi:ABC-type dipeptide/oligopeptide/nickel transport system ATPase component
MELLKINKLTFTFLKGDTGLFLRSKIFDGNGTSSGIKPSLLKRNALKEINYFEYLNKLKSQNVELITVLDKKNLSIGDGQKIGIVGPSGSGKSMTFYSAFGLIHPFLVPHLMCVDLFFKGHRISPSKARTLLGLKVAFLFQEALSSFHPYFSVGKQFHSFLKVHKIRNKKKRKKMIEKWFHLVSIPIEKLKEKPRYLSGGMLQRINIAMGLSLTPDLIIADECTSALDVTTQAQIIDIFQQLTNKSNVSVFFISHDLELVKEFCDSIVKYE